jgi:hypothetical protein
MSRKRGAPGDAPVTPPSHKRRKADQSPLAPDTIEALRASRNPLCQMLHDRYTSKRWPIMTINFKRLRKFEHAAALIEGMATDCPTLCPHPMQIICARPVFGAAPSAYASADVINGMLTLEANMHEIEERLDAFGTAFIYCGMHDHVDGHATFARVTRDDQRRVTWSVHDPNGATVDPVLAVHRHAVHVVLQELKRRGTADYYRVRFANDYDINMRGAVSRVAGRIHPLTQWRGEDERAAMCVFFSIAMLIDHLCVESRQYQEHFANQSIVRRVFHAGETHMASEKQSTAFAFVMSVFTELVRRYMPSMAMPHTHVFDVEAARYRVVTDRRRSV